jgi:hypothetical protein
MLSLIALTIFKDPSVFVDMTAELELAPGDSPACWADLNGDGWTDLISGGAVWINLEGRKFEKRQTVGSCVAADCDNDGDVDLASWSPKAIWINDGEANFTKQELPSLPASVTRGACWTDVNSDGWVDLYYGGYENWGDQISYPDLLLMNNKGSFTLAHQSADHRARGVTACDFDQDGRPDIYVSNYRLMPNDLWSYADDKMINRAEAFGVLGGDKEFRGGHSIGSCWGDFDNDGRIDLFAGNFAHVDSRGDQPKSRFLRNRMTAFDDMGTCGIYYQESYASPGAGDFDNDGDLDLFFTTVYPTASFGKKNFPVLFSNKGRFDFEDVTAGSGLENLGATYQSSWADFDNDGDLDLLTDGRLFVNGLTDSNWITVNLSGDGKVVNGAAIGAQVRLSVGGRTLTRQVEAGTGEGNQNDLKLHFGIPNKARRVDLEIWWPNGQTQAVNNVRTKRTTTVRYKAD